MYARRLLNNLPCLFCLGLLLLSCSSAQQLTDKLSNTVSTDITSTWSYKNLFPDLKSLMLSEESIKAGLAVHGDLSRAGIEKLLASALARKNVNLLVLGASVTLGGDLGADNLHLTYHYALADWWNKTVGQATGSFMHRKVTAVGGVGTTYFGHCWQEYVSEGDSFDFVTWEFAINDPDSIQYEKAVERFARDVLSLAPKPGLIFVNFVSKSTLQKGMQDCKKHEDEAQIVDFIAKTYSCTSLRWERALCQQNKGNSQLNLEALFTKHHPNVMGHAQIAYMLIDYLRTILIESLAKLQHNVDQFSGTFNAPSSSSLPEPVFLEPDEKFSISQCYTSISPGPFNQPNHILTDLQVLENNGFSIAQESIWLDVPEQRHDSTGGYITQLRNKKLKLRFNVHHIAYASQARISITLRNKYFGGKIKITLNEGTGNEHVVYADSSEKKKAGTNSIELGKVNQGTHTLSIYTMTGGCNLCAVIID